MNKRKRTNKNISEEDNEQNESPIISKKEKKTKHENYSNDSDIGVDLLGDSDSDESKSNVKFANNDSSEEDNDSSEEDNDSSEEDNESKSLVNNNDNKNNDGASDDDSSDNNSDDEEEDTTPFETLMKNRDGNVKIRLSNSVSIKIFIKYFIIYLFHFLLNSHF
jgi:hypothetical protein